MKSSRQRRIEILQRRRRRATAAKRTSIAPWLLSDRVPTGALPADQTRLVHDRTYGPRPRFYTDRPFRCIDCGKDEVWTAADQKWWYEEAKGKLGTRANRCRPCRAKRRLRRSQERRVHIEGIVAKHGLEEAARRLCLTADALARLRARWRDVSE